MKYFVIVVLFVSGCTQAKIINKPVSQPPVTTHDTIHKTVSIIDTIIRLFILDDTQSIKKEISVKDYFAFGDGSTDDYLPIINACNYCIANPKICTTVRFPVGVYVTTKPILLQNLVNGANQFFTINLVGDVSNKPYLNSYGSSIYCKYTSGYGVGMILARGVKIQNISVIGQYTFPQSVLGNKIATLKYSEWDNGSVTDSRYLPYSGFAIDPYPMAQGGSGGSSQIEISNCTTAQWMVGIAIGCNGISLNAESINLIDDNFADVKICVAIGQDQSKDINIIRPKCWTAIHTMLDGLHYGSGTGGGSVTGYGGNIAANMYELFNVNTDRFPLAWYSLYAENLFKIGSVGSRTGTNLTNCQIDLICADGYPAPDYIISGNINFYGGMLRLYTDNPKRLKLNNTSSMFRDMTLSSPPITRSLIGMNPDYPNPKFDNIALYSTGKYFHEKFDTLISIPNNIKLTIDRNAWVSFASPQSSIHANVDDYILGAPAGGYSYAYDTALNKMINPTKQIGRVTKISGDSLYLNDVGLDVHTGDQYDQIYISRIK